MVRQKLESERLQRIADQKGGRLVELHMDRRLAAPKIIVIDSFKALHDISPSLAVMRRVTHDLAGLLTAYDTTAFLVGEYSPEQVADSLAEVRTAAEQAGGRRSSAFHLLTDIGDLP